MLSVLIEAFVNKVGYVALYTFYNRCLIYSDWDFKVTLHSPSARRDFPCAASSYRDSPDHRSVRNKEGKFI